MGVDERVLRWDEREKKYRKQERVMITVVFMYAVLALTFTVAKKALSYANPYFLIAFRMIVAGAIFLFFQYIFNRKNFCLKREDILLFLKTSLFYIYLAFIPEFWALNRLTSSKVVIIYSITPFIAAALAYFLASERLTVRKVIGMIIGFLGTIPLILTPNNGITTAELFYLSKAEAVLLVAVFCGAYAWFDVKKLMNKGYQLPMINGVTMLIGGIGALFTSFAIEGVFVRHVFDWQPFLFWVLLLIFLANGIFYNMYGWHLRRYSFTLLSFVGFTCPLFGTLFGWLFLSEAVTWNHFASLILIGSGLFLFYRTKTSP